MHNNLSAHARTHCNHIYYAWQVGRYIPPAWLQHTEVEEWAGEVEKLWPDLISKDLQELEILFVEQCRDRPMYGSHFFYSLKVQCVPDLLSTLPNNLLLAFNADGMHIFSVDKKELLQQYSYADVHSWRGTRRQVGGVNGEGLFVVGSFFALGNELGCAIGN